MNAIYKEETDCITCYDMFGASNIDFCKDCLKIHTQEVEILRLGVGLFGNKAIIKKSNGELDTVYISSLTMKGE